MAKPATNTNPDGIHHLIVVPDGLAFDPAERRTSEDVSFVYRQVLDEVCAYCVAAERDVSVHLAPANAFGGPVFEQEAARRYLSARGITAASVPPTPAGPYVDTYGNAVLLRRFLEAVGAWPLPDIDLIAARRHARRAHLCFGRAGFRVRRLIAVAYQIPPGEYVVPRLFYYRHPALHAAYETLAYMKDFLFASSIGDDQCTGHS